LNGDGSAWVEHQVSNRLSDGAWSVYAADLDGDGDIDALTGSVYADRVAWYENTLGDGSAWLEHPITSSADGVQSVFAADVDGDGDLDALSAAQYANEIAWYENESGDGSVWSVHVIDGAAEGARKVLATDIDGNGAIDVLAWPALGGEVVWYSNQEGDGSAWARHMIAEDEGIPCAGDVDGDGDLDVLSSHDWEISWHLQSREESDDDGDGLAECEGDCDDADGQVWAVPSEALDLVVGADRETLAWSAPAEPGCLTGLVYDTLRSEESDEFWTDAVCVETGDGSDTQALDPDDPPAGVVYHYLVRALNACGAGSAGTDWVGDERDVAVCP
jgi:hypothetical protein